ncbi:hypothetical protein J7I80_20805 [Bacillus sp. ISL-41]|uniref:hypothetical protein n=1 Tax=Bacillus sp. ISL-41 TaxID=2819127 RepID=UPI001BEAB7E5|nr:hypothetical protein [Bacillus sp. ISL-41]MBT2644661.1 hypothetical protein [Bacillus sp. ISL-41]
MKTTILPLLFALFSSLLWLYGCSNDPINNQQYYDMVANEKSLPENMHELAFKREETPHYQYLVRMADNQSDFEDFWMLYELIRQAPETHFKEKNVFFIGLHESGSCPSEIEKVEPDSEIMKITIATPDGNCTDDATPRTFVIQIDKAESKNLESVIIVEGGTETTVPLEK